MPSLERKNRSGRRYFSRYRFCCSEERLPKDSPLQSQMKKVPAIISAISPVFASRMARVQGQAVNLSFLIADIMWYTT